jgi:hypothetical protein
MQVLGREIHTKNRVKIVSEKVARTLGNVRNFFILYNNYDSRNLFYSIAEQGGDSRVVGWVAIFSYPNSWKSRIFCYIMQYMAPGTRDEEQKSTL